MKNLHEIAETVDLYDCAWIDEGVCDAAVRIVTNRGGDTEDNMRVCDDLYDESLAILRKHLAAAEAEIRAMLRKA